LVRLTEHEAASNKPPIPTPRSVITLVSVCLSLLLSLLSLTAGMFRGRVSENFYRENFMCIRRVGYVVESCY
jgi:hypothetical protein